jgi:tetratricopeptide (TPR) repeat protein
LLLLTVGCSTQKNTGVTRSYHNLTANYNVYFNAKESVKEGLRRMDEYVVEDYTRMLPVFPETNPQAVQAAASEMEYAVQKCLKLIAFHSITARPKRKANNSEKYKEFASKSEYNKWVDDTYLLMGQASYYLQDFHKAEECFNYILRNFPKEPTKNHAYLWLSRCYIETGEYEKTLEIFKLLERDGSLPDDLKRDLLLVKADYYILKENNKEAVTNLNQALKFKMSHKVRGRYNFILAQIYQGQNQEEEAIAAYNRVVKAKPSFRMTFEAKISLIELSKGSPEEIDLVLKKMIKNVDNQQFLDRIYYAKGNVSLKSNRREEAISDFQTSVQYSLGNNNQRALSSLTVARLFFEESNYKLSYCYYDSALSVIDQNYPNYEEIVSKTNGFAALLKNLETVTREDSLQRVALMPEQERLAYINTLIARIAEEEAKQQRLAQEEQNSQSYYRTQQYRTSSFRNNDANNSNWYFYNPVTAGIGKSEFQQIWGKRKLEDNWRRKSKISLNPEEVEQADATAENQKNKEEAKPKDSDPRKVEFYLVDLPLTDSLMQVSNERIKSSLFAAGRIYLSVLNDQPRAIALFEELNKRFPSSMYELSTWIEFHKMKYKTDEYYTAITTRYPESNYAKFLVNPNFFSELENTKQARERKYEEAAALYRKGEYAAAGKLATEVLALQPDSLLLPKVKYIDMIARGKDASRDEFSQMLDKYMVDFPASPANPTVKKILDLIRQNSLAELEKMIARADSAGMVAIQDKNARMADDPFGGKYSYDEDLFHYFVISFPSDANVDVNRLIFDIANFNIDYYTSFDFDIEEIKLNDKTSLVVVRSLPSKEEGLGYFGTVIKQKWVFKSLKDVDYHYFIASSSNYRRVIADQDLLDYLRFFVKNYSKNSAPVK